MVVITQWELWKQVVVYLFSAVVLISGARFVFFYLVARDYQFKGQLGWLSAILQLAVFAGFFCFPYLYLPPNWAWDWWLNGTWNRLVALVLVSLGMILAFGTMIWFGLCRAFGFNTRSIVRTGPYRYSRNPQILGGWLMVLGVFIYLPSLYNLGWVSIWAVIGHWMVSIEEFHLQKQFGEEYERYCEETPRYLLK